MKDFGQLIPYVVVAAIFFLLGGVVFRPDLRSVAWGVLARTGKWLVSPRNGKGKEPKPPKDDKSWMRAGGPTASVQEPETNPAAGDMSVQKALSVLKKTGKYSVRRRRSDRKT